MRVLFCCFLIILTCTHAEERPRAREAGVIIGTLPTGQLNAITDVPGVLIGQVTLREGKNINTGITAIRPHAGNLFEERVPAAIHRGNGFGKLVGVTQVADSANSKPQSCSLARSASGAPPMRSRLG